MVSAGPTGHGVNPMGQDGFKKPAAECASPLQRHIDPRYCPTWAAISCSCDFGGDDTIARARWQTTPLGCNTRHSDTSKLYVSVTPLNLPKGKVTTKSRCFSLRTSSSGVESTNLRKKHNRGYQLRDSSRPYICCLQGSISKSHAADCC